MVELRININDPKTGKTYKKVLEDSQSFNNMKINDKFSGDLIGLKGFELQVTGGSDSSGFPLKGDLSGTSKRKLLISKGFAAKNLKRDGELRRRTIRGNTIGLDTAQINAKVIEGKGDLDAILGVKKEEVATEEKQ